MSTKNNLQQHLAWFCSTRPYLSSPIQIPSSAPSRPSTQTAILSTLPSQRTAQREAQSAGFAHSVETTRHTQPVTASAGQLRVAAEHTSYHDLDDDYPEWKGNTCKRAGAVRSHPEVLPQSRTSQLPTGQGSRTNNLSAVSEQSQPASYSGAGMAVQGPRGTSLALPQKQQCRSQKPPQSKDLRRAEQAAKPYSGSFSAMPSSLDDIQIVDLTSSPKEVKEDYSASKSKRKSDDFGHDRPAKRQSLSRPESRIDPTSHSRSRRSSTASGMTGDIDDFDFNDVPPKLSSETIGFPEVDVGLFVEDWDDFKENDFLDVDLEAPKEAQKPTKHKEPTPEFDDLLFDDFDDDDFDMKQLLATPKPITKPAKAKPSPPKTDAKLWGFPWSNDVKYALKDTFGLNGFRMNQLEAINATLSGKNAFVLMPTGGGKSLCYQLPAIIRSGSTSGVTVVISPLLSLMQDQVDHLKELNIKALLLNGDTPADERKAILDVLRRKDAGDFIELIYITPEMMTKNQMLINIFNNLCRNKQLARIVIDEAHCVSQWGHDFRPDYTSIGPLKQQFVGVPTIALTATATENVKLDVMHNLQMDDCEVFTQSFNRSNLTYIVTEKPKPSELINEVMKIIQSYKNQTGIIYCLSRANCEKVAEELRKKHRVRAMHYHAGMETSEKSKTQREWQEGKCKVIVATIAFGMGIDKPDVRYVIHYTLPKSLEGYYQETGRAGRDGNPSTCYMFYGRKDSASLKRMIYDGDGSPEQKDRLINMLQRVISFCENRSDCRRSQILEYFSEKFDRRECKGTCDNCRSDKVYIKCDLTEEAKAIVRVVKAMQSNQCTLAQCVEVFRGGKSKRITDGGLDTLPEYGTGSTVEKGKAERLFYLLIQRDVLEEKTTHNRAGFPQAYVQVGRKCTSFMNSSERIVLDVSATPQKPGAKTSVDKAFNNNKKKKPVSRTGVGTTAPVISVADSSPIRQRGHQKAISVDSSDGFDDAGSLENFIVDDSVEEYTPKKVSKVAKAGTKRGAARHDPNADANVQEMRENAIVAFLIDMAVRMNEIKPILRKDELCTEEALRRLWKMKPQTADDLLIEGVDSDFASLLGYELLNRIKDSTAEFEKNRDELTKNVHDVPEIGDEDDPVTSGYFDAPGSQQDKAEVEAFWSQRWGGDAPPRRELPFQKQARPTNGFASGSSSKTSQSKPITASRRSYFARRGRGGFKKGGR